MINKPVVCIGAALIDESFYCIDEPIPGTSNPSRYFRSAGGVARNVAHHLAQLGHHVELITHFGADPEGKWLYDICANAGVGMNHSSNDDLSTGRYNAVLYPDGNLFIGNAATHFDTTITVSFLKTKMDVLRSASVIQLDCNLNAACLGWLIEFCREENKSCVIDPVSVAKAARLRNINLANVMLITPNTDELSVITDRSSDIGTVTLVKDIIERGVENIWIRNGKEGSILFSEKETIVHATNTIDVVDVTGAGDAALAGWIHAYLLGKKGKDRLSYGHALAELIIQTKGAVLDGLNKDLLERQLNNRVKI